MREGGFDAAVERAVLAVSVTTRKREQSIGVRVSETKSETSTPKVTTTAKERKNWPMMPLMKMTGAKIETSESVAAMTAKTSLLPLMAAEMGSASSPRWRKMFRGTTMASSTTTPISSSSAEQGQRAERETEE